MAEQHDLVHHPEAQSLGQTPRRDVRLQRTPDGVATPSTLAANELADCDLSESLASVLEGGIHRYIELAFGLPVGVGKACRMASDKCRVDVMARASALELRLELCRQVFE